MKTEGFCSSKCEERPPDCNAIVHILKGGLHFNAFELNLVLNDFCLLDLSSICLPLQHDLPQGPFLSNPPGPIDAEKKV